MVKVVLEMQEAVVEKVQKDVITKVQREFLEEVLEEVVAKVQNRLGVEVVTEVLEALMADVPKNVQDDILEKAQEDKYCGGGAISSREGYARVGGHGGHLRGKRSEVQEGVRE